MKKTQLRRERRGTFLKTTPDSADALKRLFERMLVASTIQGENALIRLLFSRV